MNPYCENCNTTDTYCFFEDNDIVVCCNICETQLLRLYNVQPERMQMDCNNDEITSISLTIKAVPDKERR